MITTSKGRLAAALEAAVSTLGGILTTDGNDWHWDNGTRQVRISSRANAIHATRALNEPPISGTAAPQIASTLQDWLSKNATLPGGHRIALQSDTRPVQQAIIPTRVDTEIDGSDLLTTLRDLAGTDSPPSVTRSPFTTEAIEAWAAEANVRLSSQTDEGNTEPLYSIKLRGYEPARLEVTDHVTLHIDAAPLLETFADSETAPESAAACSLLAFGATASSHFIRPELTEDTLRYRATFGIQKNAIPPASWLSQAVQEITTSLRASRIELEALRDHPRLAAHYLAIRKITPTS